jgi:hypothetical protein
VEYTAPFSNLRRSPDWHLLPERSSCDVARSRAWAARPTPCCSHHLALFALCLFGLSVLRIETPRYVLVPVFLTATLIPLSVGGPAARRAGSALILLGCIAVAFLLVRALVWHRPPEVQVKRAYLKTGFYNLQVTTRLGVIPTPATRGGGLDQMGNRVLLGTGDGHLYVSSVPSGNDAMGIVELPTVVPSNREEFARALGGSSVSPTRAIDYSEKGPPPCTNVALPSGGCDCARPWRSRSALRVSSLLERR